MPENGQSDFLLKFISRWIPPLVWVYFTGLFSWLLLYLVTGDKNGIVAMLNPFAVFWFLPLPFLVLIGWYLKRREIWIGAGVGLVFFIYFWGGLFVPNFSMKSNSGLTLSVMTYNTLGYNLDVDPPTEMILTVDADVVFIQELNPELANKLSGLQEIYPYQIFDPQVGTSGLGVLSKYPIKETGDKLDFEWVGTPQLLEMTIEDQKVLLINFHMFPTHIMPPEIVEYVTQARELQAQIIHDFVNDSEKPVIAAGDMNITAQSTAYRIMTANMKDAWQEAGFGLGHTFPGSDIPGSSRTKIGEWYVPQWLVRIDYVFYTSEFQAVDVYLAPFDQLSDHRGVVTELAWTIDQ